MVRFSRSEEAPPEGRFNLRIRREKRPGMEQEKVHDRVRSARAAGVVSGAVLISRVLGVVREAVFAKLFGAGAFNDAWQVAFRIPNLLRDLFAEGALSSAFVPTFNEFLEREGRSGAWLLVSLVMSSLMVVLGGLTLLFLTFPDFFVYLLASGFSRVPGKMEITVELIRILSPFLLLVSLASVAMGILNTFNYFFIPALAPALFNLAVILTGFFLAPQFPAYGLLPVHAMAIGALAGGALQFGVQLPLLWRQGFRFGFGLAWSHPGVQKIGRLMVPAVLGVGAVQINVVVNTQLASYLQENGPVSWLNYAFRIMYLPIGLFGVAVGVVHLRNVSRQAAQRRWEEINETVAASIKLVSFLAIPSMVGLVILAAPVVRVLFERGDFASIDTVRTAHALTFYALGLLGYSCIKVYVPTFYALNDTRTPVRISLLAVAVNLIVNVALILILPSPFKYLGLALGTACSATLNSLLLAVNFRRRAGSLRGHSMISSLTRMGAAALAMGLAVLALWSGLGMLFPDPEKVGEIVQLAVCVAIGAGLYFGVCELLGVRETRLLFDRGRSQ